MQIAIPDIEYCAVMFHEPVYMLCLKLSDPSARIFTESLKILPGFKRKYVYIENGNNIINLHTFYGSRS